MNRNAMARRLVLGAIGLTLLGAGAVAALKPLRWRAQLTLLYAAGRIPDIDFAHLAQYMSPSSKQVLNPLIAARNPFEVIRNYQTSAADVRSGGELFRTGECAHCHGSDGSGGSGGPSLTTGTLKHGASDWAVYRTIRYGVTDTAMPAHPMTDEQIWQLVSFVRYLGGNQDAPATQAPKLAVNVPATEIAAVVQPTKDWLTYSGSHSSWRHSALSEISPANVGQLGLRWMHTFLESDADRDEATPLVRDGTMFVTICPARVIALDAATGHELWRFEHELTSDAIDPEYGKGPNRGVALLDDKVFFGTRDARLIALSADTGKLLWTKPLSPDAARYFVSSAPLAVGNLVVVGVATRGGGRGFIAGFDTDGNERWRFTTIPGPGEPGHETWAGESWQNGGGPPWLTGSYDAREDLLIWGVGNPKPDYDHSKRLGNNLYTNSVVALRGSTGELVWHFQFTPGDDHDWDSAQIPVLADDPVTHAKRILWANRNGFYYVLDRLTGKVLEAVPFVHQNWATGIDPSGQPILVTDSERKRLGSLVYPGNVGGTNWWSPSYDPALGLMFVPFLEQGMIFFSSTSSWPQPNGGRTFYTGVRALDAMTGARKWEYKNEPRADFNRTAGLLSTTTGLLFGGDLTKFFALESKTGQELWTVDVGSAVQAAPMTYSVNGEQFVTVLAGRNLLTFALPKTQKRFAKNAAQ